MPEQEIRNYASDVLEAVEKEDGRALAALLSMDGNRNRRLEELVDAVRDVSDGGAGVLRRMGGPKAWKLLCRSVFRAVRYREVGEMGEAVSSVSSALSAATSAVQASEDGWAAPVMVSVAKDLYGMAFLSGEVTKASMDNLTGALQQAARAVLTARDAPGTDPRRSKRAVVVPTLTLFLRAAFRSGNLVLCGPLLSTRDTLPPLRSQRSGDAVTFRYMYGRFLSAKGLYADAHAELRKALMDCPPEELLAAKRHREEMLHRRAILKLLIPLRMLWMRCPSDELLRRYDLLTMYGGLVSAFREGNVGRYERELERQRRPLVAAGVYLIWETALRVVYVRLLHRACLAYAKVEPARKSAQGYATHVRLAWIAAALRAGGVPQADLDDAVSVASEAIAAATATASTGPAGFAWLRGLVSLDSGWLVLRKENAFPLPPEPAPKND